LTHKKETGLILPARFNTSLNHLNTKFIASIFVLNEVELF